MIKENQIWTANENLYFMSVDLQQVNIREGESVTIISLKNVTDKFNDVVIFTYEGIVIKENKKDFISHFHTNMITETFEKADKNKSEWNLIPYEELEDVVKVLQMGAEKYSKDNWKKCDDPSRYENALLRHVISYIRGDKIDEESKLSHLAHAICNCLFLMWMDKNKKGK